MSQQVGGQTWRLHQGSELPDGLAIHADGADVGGHAPAGRRTIYPSKAMPLSEFNQKLGGMDWTHLGVVRCVLY